MVKLVVRDWYNYHNQLEASCTSVSFLVLSLVFTINNTAEKQMVLIVASFVFSPFLFTFLYFAKTTKEFQQTGVYLYLIVCLFLCCF